MWLFKSKVVREGYPWAGVDGIQHPGNWDVWPHDEKVRAGLVEAPYVTEPDGRLFNFVRNDDGSITSAPKEISVVKTDLVELVKSGQFERLSKTDWAYTRLADIGVAVPAEIKSYRDAVRAAAAAMVAAIKGATTTDEMSTVLASEVMQWPTGDDK